MLGRGFANNKLSHAMVAAALLPGGGLVMALAFPIVIERWSERLFHTAGGEQSSADPSALTRYAETRAFYDLLNKEPLTWVYGQGLGAPYYWDESYAVELAQYTYGNEDEFRADTSDVRFPGHSIWTYAVFSGGVIGGICYLSLFAAATVLAFRSVGHVRQVRHWPLEIAWLPFIALLAFLSQSLTINPFIERSGGLVLGMVMGLPQFLYAAAWQARHGIRAARPLAWPGESWIPARLLPEEDHGDAEGEVGDSVLDLEND